MKILFVHECLGAMGGAEANILASARGLRKKGHTPVLLHGPGTGKQEDKWTRAFSECFPIPSATSYLLEEIFSNAEKPDVIYLHKSQDLFLLKQLLDSGLRMARMVHDHDIYCMRRYKYSPFTRKICKRPTGLACLFPCLAFVERQRGRNFPVGFVSYSAKLRELKLNRRIHRMIVASHYMKNELITNRFDSGRIRLLSPTPADLTPGFRSTISDKNLIVFAGQIVRGKGVDLLLRALALVQEPFECVILGDGSHRPFCESLCDKLGLTGRVHFKGSIPQEKLHQYFKECSVFAMSSVWPEPFGMVGIEVMRYGIPVVAFDAGGISEWLNDGINGFLVEWNDISQYANRITQLLQDKDLTRKLGENAANFACEHFQFEQYISQLESILTEMVVAESPN